MHIGIIGGIGPAATTYYYRLLLNEASKLDLTITHANLTILSSNVAAGNREMQAAVFAKHVDNLKGAGANVAAITSVAGHFCIEELGQRSSLPLISVLDSINAHFAENRLKRIGILGNRVAMQSHLFGMFETVEFVVPSDDVLGQVGDAYVRMARTGECEEQDRELFHKVGKEMVKVGGAEAILLGGTDLFLAFGDNNTDYPVIDAARIHVKDLANAAGKAA